MRSARIWLSVALIATACLIAKDARANPFNLGYLLYNVTDTTGFTTSEFDVVNATGPNQAALGDPIDFPVINLVDLGSLSLTVDFSDGSSITYPFSDLTANADGESWDGPTIAIGGTNPQPIEAILSGTFSPTTIDLFGGGSETIDPAFTTVLTLSGNPVNDDQANALVTANSVSPSVPEPCSLSSVLSGLFSLMLIGHLRRRKMRSCRRVLRAAGFAIVAALLAGVLLPAGARAQVSLTAAAFPSSGVAGVTSVSLSSKGLPATATPAGTQIRIAQASCPDNNSAPIAGEIDTTASKIRTVIGSVKSVQFLIPAAAATGTYLVAIEGSNFASNDCAIVNVTHSNPVLAACLPSSSLAVLTGTTVTAYVPNGYWTSTIPGITAVNLEGPVSATPIATGTDAINACSSNVATGKTVCPANNTHVYEITGTTVNTILSSGSDTFGSFSGGQCMNCGVAVNALTNNAIIAGGFSGGGSGDGVQALNLTTNAFSRPFLMHTTVSENISIDPTRALIVTPDENDSYTLLTINSAGVPTAEYENFVNNNGAGGVMDSGEEDCTTGVSFAPLEFSGGFIYLIDLSRARLAPGSPNGWTAPGQDQFIGTTTYGGYAAGPSGGAVATGTSHLGIVQGEFGGNTFAALRMPATSGTGTPALVDYAMAVFPATSDCKAFSAGFDPHTITAYTSPNNGKASGVVTDYEAGVPAYVGVVDLATLLALPRVTGDPHAVRPGIDLVAAGVIRHVSLRPVPAAAARPSARIDVVASGAAGAVQRRPRRP